MQDPKEIEKARILTDLTDLAQSLVIGGLKKDQPEVLLVGKALLMAIGAVQTPESAELLQQLMRDYSAQARQADEKEKQMKDLLKGLGISLN